MWVGNEYQFTPHGLLGQNPPQLNPPVLSAPVVDAPQSLLPTAPQNPQVFGGQNDGGGGGAPDTASGEMDPATAGAAGSMIGSFGTLTGNPAASVLGFGISSAADYADASKYGAPSTGFGDFMGGLLGNTIVGRALGVRNFADRTLDRTGAAQTDAAAKAKHDVRSRRDFRDKMGIGGGPSGPPGSPGNQGNGPGGSAPGGGGGNFNGGPGNRNREGGFR